MKNVNNKHRVILNNNKVDILLVAEGDMFSKERIQKSKESKKFLRKISIINIELFSTVTRLIFCMLLREISSYEKEPNSTSKESKQALMKNVNHKHRIIPSSNKVDILLVAKEDRFL